MSQVTLRIPRPDDEIDMLRPHILYLRGKGYEVEAVSNGEDAVRYAQEKRFDVVLLDEMMPGMGGLATLEAIKQSHPTLPVIMITKSEEDHLMDQALGRQISDYLTKPVNPSQIHLAIKKVFESESLQRSQRTRDYVAETESAVKEMAASVNESELGLGKARDKSAQVAQKLSDLREGVEEIERQIAALQERREQELEKVAETDNELNAANRDVTDSESELAERRAAEAAARTDLETRRQTVNDLQRSTGEIETEVEEASMLLNEKQKSFDDITEAIRQICGDGDSKSREEGLLF